MDQGTSKQNSEAMGEFYPSSPWLSCSLISQPVGHPKTVKDDALDRGIQYLNALRRLALEPEMIDVTENISERIRICAWIGNNIDLINAQLNFYLNACHSCFYPEDRQVMQVLAAPLAGRFGVDALCNFLIEPVTILIDVGRLYPEDWLSVVAHEYAHGHLRYPGHEAHFLEVISHLCLGLGLEPPFISGKTPQQQECWLQNWPHCEAKPKSLAFWRGEG